MLVSDSGGTIAPNVIAGADITIICLSQLPRWLVGKLLGVGARIHKTIITLFTTAIPPLFLGRSHGAIITVLISLVYEKTSDLRIYRNNVWTTRGTYDRR